MAETKTKIQVPNVGLVDAVEVEITESSERWTDVKLADGTTIRTKPVILTVFRVDGHYDQDGNPIYQIKANQVMTATAPDHLKKGAQSSDKTH
ncbi:MAG: hypothetical protein HYX77_02055 [Acidobacteria bacterium]|nr:hypothetical protein [Acidobacteriota bacterium]